MDWGGLMLDPIYATLGVSAVLTVDGSDYPLTAIDKSAGTELPGRDGAELQAFEPAAIVRAAEIVALGLTADGIVRGTIAFNGKAWVIISHIPKPVPSGEAAGEYYLLISKPD